jgi:hypothetical protein
MKTSLYAVFFLGLAGVAGAQTRQVWVHVSDKAGAPYTGLSKEQFSVIEDGAKYPVARAEPMAWPTRLTVLVDNGGKSGDYLQDLRNGVRALFAEVTGKVEASLLTLAPQPRWIVRPTMLAGELGKGVGLITPDPGSGKFFEGLREAADRAVKDKADFFPVFVVIASTFGNSSPPSDARYLQLQKDLYARAATVHFVLLEVASESRGEVTGVFQSRVGNQVTAMTGGRYNNINAATRLDTLLPELGKQIARSAEKQSHQYRLTYEPSKRTTPTTIGVDVEIAGATIDASPDGHLP